MPGRRAWNVYVAVPPGSAPVVEVSSPAVNSLAGCPGKASDTFCVSWLCSRTVTVSPSSTTRTGPGAVGVPAASVENPQIGMLRPSTWVVPDMAYRSQTSVAAPASREQPEGCSLPTAAAWLSAGAAADAGAAGAAGDRAGGRCHRSRRDDGSGDGGSQQGPDQEVCTGEVPEAVHRSRPQLVGQPAGGSMRKTVIIPPKVAP